MGKELRTNHASIISRIRLFGINLDSRVGLRGLERQVPHKPTCLAVDAIGADHDRTFVFGAVQTVDRNTLICRFDVGNLFAQLDTFLRLVVQGVVKDADHVSAVKSARRRAMAMRERHVLSILWRRTLGLNAGNGQKTPTLLLWRDRWSLLGRACRPRP